MMSGAPLITMRETKFNNNSHFKTLSDEDLFTDEVEPLNSILSKFKYWPRNGNKIYTKKSMLFCGFLLFTFGFLIGFFIFGRISFSFNVLPADRTISIHDVQEIFQRSINVHQTYLAEVPNPNQYSDKWVLIIYFIELPKINSISQVADHLLICFMVCLPDVLSLHITNSSL